MGKHMPTKLAKLACESIQGAKVVAFVLKAFEAHIPTVCLAASTRKPVRHA